MTTTLEITGIISMFYVGIAIVLAIEWFARIRENPENRPGGGTFAVWLVSVFWPIAAAGVVLGVILMMSDAVRSWRRR